MECETICLTKFRQTWDNMNVLRCFWRLSKIFKNNVFYIHTKQFSLKFSLLDPLNITQCPIWTLYAPCHLQEGCLQLNWSNAFIVQMPRESSNPPFLVFGGKGGSLGFFPMPFGGKGGFILGSGILPSLTSS